MHNKFKRSQFISILLLILVEYGMFLGSYIHRITQVISGTVQENTGILALYILPALHSIITPFFIVYILKSFDIKNNLYLNLIFSVFAFITSQMINYFIGLVSFFPQELFISFLFNGIFTIIFAVILFILLKIYYKEHN